MAAVAEDWKNRRRPPPTLTSQTSAYYDPRLGKHCIKVHPGGHYVTGSKDELLVTVLGSCVSACIRDPRSGFGGMNHFMLPESESGMWGKVTASMRYGNHAMEVLINDVLKTGCRREHLEIKVFGGADMIMGMGEVGTKNGRFVKQYLATEGLRATAIDLGDRYPRRILFDPSTGKAKRLFLRRSDDVEELKEEIQYEKAIVAQSRTGGAVELF